MLMIAPVEMVRIVRGCEAAGRPTNARAIASFLCTDIGGVCDALASARASGRLERYYDPARPFGQRDCYRTTYDGRVAIGEVKPAC